jgi:hypothetical protein
MLNTKKSPIKKFSNNPPKRELYKPAQKLDSPTKSLKTAQSEATMKTKKDLAPQSGFGSAETKLS